MERELKGCERGREHVREIEGKGFVEWKREQKHIERN